MNASLFSDLGTIIQGDKLQLTGNDIGSPALASFLFKIFFCSQLASIHDLDLRIDNQDNEHHVRKLQQRCQQASALLC